jgi:hypothetical protein
MKITEETEQKKTVQYLEILKRRGKILFYFAPMNENKQSYNNRATAIKIENKAKAMGKKAGVSDLVVVLKNRLLFIEMKKAPKKLKNGKLSYTGISVSDNQKKFIEIINQSSVCKAYICYGFDEAKNIIDKNIKE